MSQCSLRPHSSPLLVHHSSFTDLSPPLYYPLSAPSSLPITASLTIPPNLPPYRLLAYTAAWPTRSPLQGSYYGNDDDAW